MSKIRFFAVMLLVLGTLIGWFIYSSEISSKTVVSDITSTATSTVKVKQNKSWLASYPFKLGLDLNGGSHLVYQAEISSTTTDVDGAMQSLRDVIERRINAFGVSEPIVQTETAKIAGGESIHKLIVEIPGVTDPKEAIALIGQTPTLEFRIEKKVPEKIDEKLLSSTTLSTSTLAGMIDARYEKAELTGRYLSKATIQFDQKTGKPQIGLEFNKEGGEIFAKLTGENVGKVIGIFLDGTPISLPVVNDAIKDGKAVITGTFGIEEARSLARNLNYGALPVKVDLVGTQSIGASLGTNALNAAVLAGIWGFIIVALFLILWYRLPGVVAVVSLAIYTVIMLAIFKLLPVVLTSAGLAGLILSIGMAVDGNILIFERMREELAKGVSLNEGIREGFARAWASIRDSNLSSIITAVILYTLATSALVKGFALVFLIGVLVSMFTAITVSRTLLLAIGVKSYKGIAKFLFGNGFKK
ncbi:MAG: protein translocase subunit SecD [bacterium]